MRELLRVADPAVICFIESLFKEQNVEYLIADQHISMVEGSIGIFPKRFLIPDELWEQGRRILEEAGLAKEFSDFDASSNQ